VVTGMTVRAGNSGPGVSALPCGRRGGIPRSRPSRPDEAFWLCGLIDHDGQRPGRRGGQPAGPPATRRPAAPRSAAAPTEIPTCSASLLFRWARPLPRTAHRPGFPAPSAAQGPASAEPAGTNAGVPLVFAALPAARLSNHHAGQAPSLQDNGSIAVEGTADVFARVGAITVTAIPACRRGERPTQASRKASRDPRRRTSAPSTGAPARISTPGCADEHHLPGNPGGRRDPSGQRRRNPGRLSNPRRECPLPQDDQTFVPDRPTRARRSPARFPSLAPAGHAAVTRNCRARAHESPLPVAKPDAPGHGEARRHVRRQRCRLARPAGSARARGYVQALAPASP
jgi:hypothetical protein